MKKKIKNMRFGFTIAELLITMFIAMIVAAAMVPLVGPKKIKFPEFNKVHGIYACYWDNEGNLQAYYADTNQNAPYNTDDLVKENYCTFPAQASADHFEIYAISSGSPGFYNNSDFENSLKANVSKSSSPINQGDISLGNYHLDMKGISANKDDELYTVLDDKNKKISLKDMVKKTITDWYENGEDYDKPYAVITSLNTALARGGGGKAKKITVDKTKSSGGDIECTVDAQVDSTQKYSPKEWFTGTVNEFKQTLKNSGKCYGYIHGAGSDSATGVQLKPGYKILLPVSGDSGYLSSNGDSLAFSVNFSHTQSVAKQYQLQLYFPPRIGDDAYYSVTAGQVKTNNAPAGYKQISIKFPDEEVPIRFMDKNNKINNIGYTTSTSPVTGTIKLVPYQGLNDGENSKYAFEEVVSKGTPHGLEVNEGKICYELNNVCQDKPDDIQRKQSASFMNEGAFTWSQNGIVAQISYVKAGKSGNEVVYRTSNLGGNRLYLFPSSDNTPTVVSKVNDISDANKKEYVVSAPAIENSNIGGGTDQEPAYLLHMNELPFPIDKIVNETKPNNNNLTYVNAIRSSRFKNALGLICNDTLDLYGSTLSSCPGYGGAGAYPLLSRFDKSFTVEVKNNQDGLKETSHSYIFNSGKIYDYRAENGKQPGQNIKCRNEGDSFQLPNGTDVCRGSRQQMGRGAVVILW